MLFEVGAGLFDFSDRRVQPLGDTFVDRRDFRFLCVGFAGRAVELGSQTFTSLGRNVQVAFCWRVSCSKFSLVVDSVSLPSPVKCSLYSTPLSADAGAADTARTNNPTRTARASTAIGSRLTANFGLPMPLKGLPMPPLLMI